MNTKLAAAAAVFVLILTSCAEARHHRHSSATVSADSAQPGHLALNNDGKSIWVPDANGSPAAYTGHKARGRAASRERKVRLASIDSAQPVERTSEAPKGDIKLTHNGMVTVQTAQGFPITVHPAYASKFLRFFALLKEHGYTAPQNITRCWAGSGSHKPGSNHYIGAACDIQYGWNGCASFKGVRRCAPSFIYHMDAIIKQAGLYSGCAFGDCGHVEAIRGLHNRAPNLYASVERFKSFQSTANYQP